MSSTPRDGDRTGDHPKHYEAHDGTLRTPSGNTVSGWNGSLKVDGGKIVDRK
ncbi:MAG: hypothetical protein ACIAQ0_08385 [Phycisphaerales bacterium JB058]